MFRHRSLLGPLSLALLLTCARGVYAQGKITIHANPVAKAGESLVIVAEPTDEVTGELTWNLQRNDDAAIDPFDGDFEGFDDDQQNRILFLPNAPAGTYRFTVSAMGETVTAGPVTVVVSDSATTGAATNAPPTPRPAPPVPDGVFEGLPGSAEAEAPPESANVTRFKEQLTERITAIRLHVRDVRFNKRRLDVASTLKALAADANLDTIPKFNAELKQRIVAMVGPDVVAESVYRLWQRLFNNDAPALAGENDIAYQTIDDLKLYYRYFAEVLESEQLSDEVFTAEVARFLRERGYTITPTGTVGGTGYTRHWWRWHHR